VGLIAALYGKKKDAESTDMVISVTASNDTAVVAETPNRVAAANEDLLPCWPQLKRKQL
jgi:hypothetical protein